ncbi:ubiquitinyl hydrolase 1 [Malassezia sp. CBS 17886]|nr:ubiquitinyl hydrolase 1 [Malassezia sp. CBS 17886]
MSWVPLEANPALFQEWSRTMGLDTSQFGYHDVFGLDEELLAMVPAPAHAVLFLFPLTAGIEARHRAEDAAAGARDTGGALWFPQKVGNACGTIGLLHAIANSSAVHGVTPGTPLAELLADAREATPEARARLLERSVSLQSAHGSVAAQGQTQAPGASDPVDLHFVAFVRSADGQLLELDGRRAGPVAHDVDVPTENDVLARAAQFVQEYYISAEPDQVQFNLIALGPGA